MKVLGRTFSSSDARRLISEHSDITEKLTEIQNSETEYSDGVKKAAEKYINNEVIRTLNGISVDEIGREKKGIRIKNLKAAGIENIGQIFLMSPYELDSVNGIGEESVQTLKSEAAYLYSVTRNDTKIKLSLDNDKPESDSLLIALYKYRYFQSARKEICEILNFHDQNIVTAVEDVKPSTKGFRWLFLSKERKEKAQYAYTYLLECINGNYGKKAESIIKNFIRIKHIPIDFVKGDFAAFSFDYINTMEQLCPGMLGTEADFRDMPEEIAKNIQAQDLNLNGFKGTLRHYQELGVKYILCQKRVLLGDEMGLGKTVQAIAAMVSLNNTGAAHFAVICPASVLTNWCREIKKFSDIFVTEVHGWDKGDELREWVSKGGIAVTTYETAKSLTIPPNLIIDMLTVDEAHFIKNPQAQRTKAVAKLCAKADNVLFMTGTALENRVDEMRNLISMLNPQISAKISGMEALSAAPVFRKIISPVYYRRRREDVLTELPELIENDDWCNLLTDEKKIYEDAILSDNFADARRVSWNIDDLSNSSKARRLLEIIEDARDDGRKVIVFSFFLDTIEKIRKLLGEHCMPPINGSVSPAVRQQIVDEFGRAPAGTVLAAQIIAGGTGLNIQTASVIVICEPQFKPSLENQAISRAYRMGQVRNVLVHRLLCENTVDERIKDILDEKQTLFDAFADESEAAAKSVEIDNNNITTIMEEEKQRIENNKDEKNDDNC